MKINAIESASNALLKRVRSLHQRAYREKLGQFILEGPKLLSEAFDKGIKVEDVIFSKSSWQEGGPGSLDRQLDSVTVVDDRIFADLVTTTGPCQVVAVARQARSNLKDCLKGDRSLLVVCDAIQDPGNLGTIIRSALAFGATGVALTRGTVDPYNPKVVRSAMGALFSLPVVSEIECETLISGLKQAEIKVVALEPTAAKPFWQTKLSGPIALIFGNEGRGLSRIAREQADELVTIPIKDQSESLNAAIACSIVLFECARERRT